MVPKLDRGGHCVADPGQAPDASQVRLFRADPCDLTASVIGNSERLADRPLQQGHETRMEEVRFAQDSPLEGSGIRTLGPTGHGELNCRVILLGWLG